MGVKGRDIKKTTSELVLGSVSTSATGFLCNHKLIISYVISIEVSRRIQTLIAQNECESNTVLPHYLLSLVMAQGRHGPSHRTYLSRVLLCVFIVSWTWSGDWRICCNKIKTFLIKERDSATTKDFIKD